MNVKTTDTRARAAATTTAWVIAAALFGIVASVLTAQPLSATGGCDNKACDTEYNTCFNTDLKYNCSGDPCKSTSCNAM